MRMQFAVLGWCLMLTACGPAGTTAKNRSTPDASSALATSATSTADRDAASQSPSDAGTHAAGCSLAGKWVVERISFANVDNPLIAGAQKNSTWYFLDIAQDGENVRVTRGMWCGATTTGDATVNFSEATSNAIRGHIKLDGRRGTYRMQGDGCALDFERVYSVTGVANASSYLAGAELPPGRASGNPELTALTPLPKTLDNPDAEDWDGDGNPGVRYLITDSPVGSGVRHAVQRDWHAISGSITGTADDFRVPATYDFEEVALSATPALFASGAFARKGAPHQAHFKRVAADFDAGDDAATCSAVRALLPHAPLPRDAP